MRPLSVDGPRDGKLPNPTGARSKQPDLKALGASKPGTVAIVQWPDADAEIDGIVSAIAADVGSERREPGQILVLTNWRRIGERIRARLNELDIPARSFFTEEELGSDDAREALALLRVVVDRDDAPALRVLVGLGDATGRSDAYQRVLAFCRANAQTPARVLQRLLDGEKLGLSVPALVQRYGHAMAKALQLRELELPELVDALLPEGSDATNDLRATALDALVAADNPGSLLDALLAAITQDDVPQTPDFVRVMSLHKSKGLTSDAVFVVGAVDGVLPTVRSEEPGEVAAATEEGRRLFYVALTRAADELVISGAVSMDLADANARGVRYDKKSVRTVGDRHVVRTVASPYIAELGPAAPKPQRGTDWLNSRP